jgi:hypothetical protein
MITANRRASATIAFFIPRRLAGTRADMAKVVQHPSAANYRQKLDRTARDAEEKEYQRQHRKYLKKNKPQRDRLRAMKKIRHAAADRIEYPMERAARALAERKYPSPGRDQDSAFVDAYRDLFHKVIAAAEDVVIAELESKLGKEGRRKFEKFWRDEDDDEDVINDESK